MSTTSDFTPDIPAVDITAFQTYIRQFARARDWEQFHNPKNLVMALSAEAAELSEIFQWLTPAQAQVIAKGPKHLDISDEIADVFIYLMRIADVLGVDMNRALHDKMKKNAGRYPVEKAKGSAAKYSEL